MLFVSCFCYAGGVLVKRCELSTPPPLLLLPDRKVNVKHLVVKRGLKEQEFNYDMVSFMSKTTSEIDMDFYF